MFLNEGSPFEDGSPLVSLYLRIKQHYAHSTAAVYDESLGWLLRPMALSLYLSPSHIGPKITKGVFQVTLSKNPG